MANIVIRKLSAAFVDVIVKSRDRFATEGDENLCI